MKQEFFFDMYHGLTLRSLVASWTAPLPRDPSLKAMQSFPSDTLSLVLGFVSDDVYHLLHVRRVCVAWGYVAATVARRVCISGKVTNVVGTLERLYTSWMNVREVDLTFVDCGAPPESHPHRDYDHMRLQLDDYPRPPPHYPLRTPDGHPENGLPVLEWCAARHLTVTVLPRNLPFHDPTDVRRYFELAPSCAIELALRLIRQDCPIPPGVNGLSDEDLIAAVFREGGQTAERFCVQRRFSTGAPPPALLEHALIQDETSCDLFARHHFDVFTMREAMCGALQFSNATLLTSILGPAATPMSLPESLHRTLALRMKQDTPFLRLAERLADVPLVPVPYPTWQNDCPVLPWDQFIGTHWERRVMLDIHFFHHAGVHMYHGMPHGYPHGMQDMAWAEAVNARSTPASDPRVWDLVAVALQSPPKPSSPEQIRQQFSWDKRVEDVVTAVTNLVGFDHRLASLTAPERAIQLMNIPDLPRRTLQSGMSLPVTLCLAVKEASVRREERCAFAKALGRERLEHPDRHWHDRYQSAVAHARAARTAAYQEPRFARLMEGRWTKGLRDLQWGFAVLRYGDPLWFLEKEEEEQRLIVERQAMHNPMVAAEVNRLSMNTFYRQSILRQAEWAATADDRLYDIAFEETDCGESSQPGSGFTSPQPVEDPTDAADSANYMAGCDLEDSVVL